ncbi:MAG: glucuronate isomerase [Verrucomicrobia bacterium]|nr:glucuronate isomerase [Verrucomicrobiota bacterium]
MSTFLHDDFLLGSPLARRLYHETAAPLPIVDYHCHLDPHDLATDRRFENLAQLWVTGDPYKHRAMRIVGVPERVITGDASDREKFDAWAATVPHTLGNPLHHWTALELRRYFDLDEPLTSASADRIWSAANARLAGPGFTARGLLARRGVACVCTSDRLLDDLSAHTAIARDGGGLRVWPSLRADDIVAVEAPGFPAWVRQLGRATDVSISDYDAFRTAVTRRLDAFSDAHGKLSDHGLDDFHYVPTSEAETAALFARCLAGESLSPAEVGRLRSGLLRFLGGEYARRGWIMQLHLGAQRRTSSRLRRLAGPAGGYAAIGPGTDVASLVAWLDDLEEAGALPRTILYPLNPADFAPLAVLAGSFVEDGVRGKVQLGPAWWFNDHALGMRAQLEAVANYGLLAVFIGMTTDSRSLLSLVRHEYFRRVLCDWIGAQVAAGALPDDPAALTTLVQSVSHDNARRALAL